MPEISRFDGIIITMSFNDHSPPHFHIEYNGMEAIFDIDEGAIIKGAIPSRQARLVARMGRNSKNELLEMWDTNEYRKIEPLI